MRRNTQHRHLAIISLDVFDEFHISAHILLLGGNGCWREIVFAKHNHHQVGAIGFKIIFSLAVSVEHALPALWHIVGALLHAVAVVAHDALTGMCHQHIVGVEISCHDAAVSLIAVLGFEAEMLVGALALGAVAAGVAVANHLNEAFSWFNGKQLAAACRLDGTNSGAAKLALGALLQPKHMLAFS